MFKFFWKRCKIQFYTLLAPVLASIQIPSSANPDLMSDHTLENLDNTACYMKDDQISAQPSDGRKPPIYYVKGWQFTVQQHIPSPPVQLDIFKGCTFDNREERDKMENMHPIKRCLQYPPLPGSYGPFSLELQIQGSVRIGDCHHAQLVVVEVLTEDPPVEGLSQGQPCGGWLSYIFQVH